MQRSISILVLIAAGCADLDSTTTSTVQGVTSSELVKSGFRLRAEYYTADGFRQSTGTFWDAQLQMRCAFEVDRDGAYRCFPQSPASTPVYLDASCSQRVVVYLQAGTAAPTVPRFVVDQVSSLETTADCNELGRLQRQELLELGAQLSVPTTATTYADFSAYGLGCLPTGTIVPDLSPPGAFTAYVYGLTERDPDVLVSAHVERRHAGSRLDEQVLVGADGSRAHVLEMGTGLASALPSYYDTTLDENVTPVTTSRGTSVDREVVWGGRFSNRSMMAVSTDYANASCSTAAVATACGYGADLLVPHGGVFANATVDPECKLDYAFDVLDDTLVSQPYYKTSSACRPYPPSGSDATYLVVGSAFAPSRYVSGDVEIKPNHRGTLASLVVHNDDCSEAIIGAYDTALAAPCEPNLDGTCAPMGVAANANTYFADAACTQSVIVGDPTQAAELQSCNRQPFAVFARVPSSSGGSEQIVKITSGPYLGSSQVDPTTGQTLGVQLYMKQGLACAKAYGSLAVQNVFAIDSSVTVSPSRVSIVRN